jgi:Zn-finger protein
MWIRDKENRKIWDCQSCDFIHRIEVVSRIFELLYENKKISKIKKIIQREFCR